MIRLVAWLTVALSGSCAFAASPSAASIEAMRALFEVHHAAGHAAQAFETLERLDAALPPHAPERARLADSYLRIGQAARAIAIWESASRGPSGLSYDDRLQLARLYEKADRKADAFALWKQLAREADSPSRRSLVEDRLLDAAEALHELDALASELRTELGSGRSGAPVRGFLVRVLMRAGNKAGAIAAARGEESGGADDVERLKAQAEVFRGVGDRDAYDLTLRRLVVLDRPQAASHLRNLVLNAIERGDETRMEEVRRLLDELRETGGEAVSAQFEAGALALANMPDAAIATYRRAIAAIPAIADNWLLLGDLLKKRRGAGEALSLFQTLIERDAGDAEFIAGVDGLLNTAAPDEYTSPDRSGRAALEWARVRILERLIWKGERSVFYSVLQETGEPLGGAAGRMAALSESLPIAGERRVAVLRELITLAAQGDPASKNLRVEYGRRLTALGAALPPDVHIALGKAFLEHGDRHAAQRTFERAADESDRSGVRVMVAVELERAGMEAEAAAHYAAALGGDARNFEVLLRLARLRERTDDRDGAHHLYGNALRQLLRQQPARGEDVPFDFRTWYPNLLRGYLATWPREAARAQTELDDIGRMLEEEFRLASSLAVAEPAASLRPFGRLDRIARFARRVAWATRHAPLAERWDRALASRFPADAALAQMLAQERADWGFDTAARQFATGPAGLESPEIARRLAVMNGDRAKIAALARDWLRRGEPVAALRWAQGRVDPQDYAALCREIAAVLRRDPSTFALLLSSQPRFLAEVESSGGERILEQDRLLQLLLEPRMLRQLAYAGPEHIDYLAARLPPAKRLEWATDASRTITSDPMRAAFPLLALWRHSLAEPLEPEFAAGLAAHVMAALRNAASAEGQWLDEISAMLIVPRLHASNISWARRVSDSWCLSTRQDGKYYEVSYLLAAGRIDAALSALAAIDVEVVQDADADAFAQARQARLRALHSLLLPRHSARFEQQLQQASVHARYALLYSPEAFFALARRGEADPAEAEAFLRAALQESPDDERLLAWRYEAYRHRGSRTAELFALQRLHRQHPENMAYRAALFRIWLDLQNPAEAVRVKAGNLQGDPETRAPEEGNELLVARDRILSAAADTVGNLVRALWQQVDVTESLEGSNPEDPLAMTYANIQRLVLDVVTLRSEEIEDILRAMSPRQTHDLPRLYGLLADAYRREGSAGRQRELIGRKILRDESDAHDDALWIALLEKEGELSADLREIFDRLLQREGTLSPHVLLSMARLAASSHDVSMSERLYRAVIVRTLFAPNLSAPQMAAEIKRVLPAARAHALTQDMLRLLEPDAAEPPLMHRCYRNIVASVQARARDRVRLISLLRAAAATPDPDEAADFPPYCKVSEDAATRLEAALDWIDDDALPGVAVAATISLDGELGLPDSRLLLLTMLAKRLHRNGDDGDAARVIRHIGTTLIAEDHFSSPAVQRAVEVAEQVGHAFDVRVLTSVIERGLLHPARIAPLLQRIAEGGDVAGARALGEIASRYTHAPALIDTLTSLAERSGNPDVARHWRTVRQADDAARELLQR